MSHATKTLNIGPGCIATPSVKGGPAFSLSSEEWIAIQVYVANGQALPYTTDLFKKSLGPGAPKDLSDFDRLVAAYRDIYDHVNGWKEDTFPATVNLANDIFHYSEKVPVYYKPLLPLAKKLTKNPKDEEAKAELKALLKDLSGAAKANHDNAAIVVEKIKGFSEKTSDDKKTLSGPDGLVKYYNDEYGTTSADVIELKKDLDAQKIILDGANAEFNRDIIVATTTPTYAWIPFIGWIAATIVSGTFGGKAIAALVQARAVQEKINSLDDKLQADASLLIAIHNVETGLNSILGTLNAALPIIQKIQGVWGAIGSDLDHILKVIEDDIASAPPIIMSLGVEQAINEWTAVGQEANTYRVNAFVTFQPKEQS